MIRLRSIRSARTAAPDAAATADTVLRVAVLLQAGVTPSRSWQHLAVTGDPTAIAVTGAVSRGVEVGDAIAARGGAWAEVALAWRVAVTVGSPLADSLRGIAATLRDAQESADAVRVALAEPAGTARLMGWLPLVAVGLGIALGFDTLGVLLRGPVGVVCLVSGTLLLLAARRWTAALVARAEPAPGIAGLDADLLAIALGGGVSIDRARDIVGAVGQDVRRPGSTSPGAPSVPDAPGPSRHRARREARAGPAPPGPERASPAVIESAETTAVLDLSRTAGVPAVELLRAAAALARHRSRTDGRLRAARLSSRLLLPLGICTLPAFLLLGVAPMLLSVLSGSSVSL